ncbi:MAG: adenine phosphoribosyltransferase [Myxococcales bacterium]|nr:adenine phosphoribosyltransferase [Myxococcales bacterium]
MNIDDLKTLIRDVPDFPKPGIMFKDITPMLADAKALHTSIALIGDRLRAYKPDVIVGIESRGFLFGAPLAIYLGTGFVPVRKPGKLPADVVREEYDLEYGKDSIEIHRDAIAPGARVIVVDDVIATGGTAKAACDLVQHVGGEVVAAAFLIELSFLEGGRRLGVLPQECLIRY